MFGGFILDVEGTLVDSVSQNLRSLQDALEKSGHRITIQTLRPYSGLDGDQTLQLVAPDASGPERSAILDDRREIFERDYLPSVKPLEGAREAVRTLAKQGSRVALSADCKGRPSSATCPFWTSVITSPRPPAATTLSTASPTHGSSASPSVSLVSPARKPSWSATRHTTPKQALRQGRKPPAFSPGPSPRLCFRMRDASPWRSICALCFQICCRALAAENRASQIGCAALELDREPPSGARVTPCGSPHSTSTTSIDGFQTCCDGSRPRLSRMSRIDIL